MADNRVCGPHMDEVCANFEFNNSKMTDSWDEIITDAQASVPGSEDNSFAPGDPGNPPNQWIPDPSPVAPTSTVNDDGYVSMKVPDTGDRIVRQSKQYFGSKSYKYNTALFTAVLNVNAVVVTAGEVNGCISRVGVFDDKDDKNESTDAGFFFEYETIQATTFNDADGNATDLVHPLKVGIRYNSTANTLGDVLVTQQSFNVNDLNRHAHIQINDWSQIYTFEIKYNAIGHVEWAIYLDGERILLHKEQDITGIIHTLPHFILPLRFEIENNKTLSDGDTDITTKTDGTTTSDEMRQFHTSMLCEAGSTPPCTPGVNVAATDIRTLKPVNSLLYTIDSFSYLPVFSVKLNASYVRMPIKLYEILYLVHKRGPFMYALIRTSASSGTYATNLSNDGVAIPVGSGDWVVGNTNRLDYNITADAIGDLTDCLYEQYVDADCHGGIYYQASTIKCTPAPIASNIAGDPDFYTLVVKKMSHLKATANFDLRWAES